MEVTFLGTGSAIPSGRAQSGVLIEGFVDDPLLVDCGSGVLDNLYRALAGTEKGFDDVPRVVFTHSHLDHMSDFLPLVKADWLVGREGIEVYGPDGVRETVEGVFEAFDYMKGRVDVEFEEVEPGEPFEMGGETVETFETVHSVPSAAYRFGDLALSGDTEPVDGIAEFAEGCDTLVHECSFPDDVDVGNHTRPSELASVLSDCDVERVYLTHLYPHTRGREDEMVETVREGFDRVVDTAEDLKTFTV